MNVEPWLWLLAGPNGAGKSTYAPNLPVQEIINPDDIAREFKPDAPEKAALSAGREAIRRMLDMVERRQSFAVETTLSGQVHVQVVTRAKSDNWSVGLIYVGLRSSDLAIERVHQRTLSGGHDVPAADVRRRYERSLRNLAIVYQLADLVMVFDNSSVQRRMKKVLETQRGEIIFRAPRLPGWVSRSLGAIIGPHPKK